jgi:glycosyltransferase involved in cell wall biosynthesis
VERIRADNIIVIPNGIRLPENRSLDPSREAALRAELGLQPGMHLVCSVGRLTEQKGHRFLLEAIPIVRLRQPKTIFVIAGDGPLLKELKDQAEALNLAPAVNFLGNRPDVADLLSLAVIFILPSLWEGLPIALLEAMGAGVAVIASQVDAVEGLVVDNHTGLLVPPSDSQALSQAILRLLDEPEFRVNLGQQGKRLVAKDFNQDQMCNMYRNLFENLLEGRK